MTFLFFIFAAVTLVCGVGVVLLRSPVSSALAMITTISAIITFGTDWMRDWSS